MARRRGLGRVEHWDPRNEAYLLGAARPGLPATARGLVPRALETSADVARVPRRSRRWRVYWAGDQGATPRCTAFGSLTALHCLPVSHSPKPVVAPDALYPEIQAIDRAEGRVFAEGATTNAAMEALRRRGVIGGYWWADTEDVALDALAADSATVNGTDWYPSMWQRDAEGIVRMPGPTERPAGGHLWCAAAYDARRDLVWHPSTWGDGLYGIPGDLYRRLQREGGECAVMRDLRPTP